MDDIPDKRSSGDWVREAARAAVSVLPVAGGPAQVVVEAVFRAPLERRRDQWFNELASLVQELQGRLKELTPEKLSRNEAFTDAAIHATQAAMRTQHADKIAALRNALLNSALSARFEPDEQLMFIRLVDQLTPSHLLLLAFLHGPEDWMTAHQVDMGGMSMGGMEHVVARALPSIGRERDVAEQILRDLQSDGLVQQGQIFGITMSGRGLVARRTTNRGQRFIEFISRPQ